jgi:hypothetical protein
MLTHGGLGLVADRSVAEGSAFSAAGDDAYVESGLAHRISEWKLWRSARYKKQDTRKVKEENGKHKVEVTDRAR